MFQIDKYCPISKSNCQQNCTFFIKGETMQEDKCQIGEYVRQHTPNGKSATRRAKPLLEGSDKK